MNAKEFITRMQNFVADKPSSLSMEIVDMCATMLQWSKHSHAIALADFTNWICHLKEDGSWSTVAGTELDGFARQALDVQNEINVQGAEHLDAQSDE